MAVKNVSGSTSSPVTSRANDASGPSKAAKATDMGMAGLVKNGVAPADGKGVDVAVSDKARARAADQKKAMDIAMKTPDVREDRVAALKAQIDAGTYKVDSGKIADGMVREAVMEHLANDANR